MKRCILIMAALLVCGWGLATQAAPEVLEVGDEEACGVFQGTRPSIATDSLNQPHIIIDRNSDNMLYIYHKIGGVWSEQEFARTARGSRYDASRLYIPHMEIDSKDRAWISAKFGCKEWGSMLGGPLWVLENMTTAPTEKTYRYKLIHKGYQMVVLDPYEPDNAVILGGRGAWAKININGDTIAGGNMNSGLSGEKIRFWISPRTGQPGIWHSAMGGCSTQPSAYQNNTRSASPAVTYAAYNLYSDQGSDFWHPGVCGDAKNPNIAYMCVRYNAGLIINVWDGTRMLFGGNAKLLDSAADQPARFPAQMIPAPGDEGGVLIAWSTWGGNVRMAHIAQDGTITGVRPGTSDPYFLCLGYRPALTMDKQGYVHMAYVRSGMKYRKLRVTGAIGQPDMPLVTAKDFDGDGKDDVTTFDYKTARWYINCSMANPVQGYPFGAAGDMPVPGNYNSVDMADLAVYNPTSGIWRIMNQQNMSVITQALGGAGCIPVPGDYNDDGLDDVAVVSNSSGAWRWYWREADAVDAPGTTTDMGLWGNENMAPIPGDYDGDGFCDMAVVESNKAVWTWYIRRSSDSGVTQHDAGQSGDVIVQADYDNDGATEVAFYRRSTAGWYIDDIAGGPDIYWGYGETMPVRGDYDGDGRADIGVYDFDNGKWFVRLSDSGRMLGMPPVTLGGATDVAVPGDYDGDGTNDVASYQPTTGTWTIWESSKSKDQVRTVAWGSPIATAVPGDYDGDGATDIAVYVPTTGNWHIMPSDGSSQLTIGWGGPDATAVPGDYDGDQITDIAVYVPTTGNWHIMPSSGISHYSVGWGSSSARAVPADYDGDNKTDIAVYVPLNGNWYILPSSGIAHINVAWGFSGATPVPGNYDSDNKDDIAVYVPATGNWHIMPSDGSSHRTVAWGSPSHEAVQADYDGDGQTDIGAKSGSTWSIWLSGSNRMKADELPFEWGGSEELPIGGNDAK